MTKKVQGSGSSQQPAAPQREIKPPGRPPIEQPQHVILSPFRWISDTEFSPAKEGVTGQARFRIALPDAGQAPGIEATSPRLEEVTAQARKASTLEAVEAAVASIKTLPPVQQERPWRVLNLCLNSVPWSARSDAALLLARETVAAGSDATAIEHWTRGILPDSATTLDAVRTLWRPVHSLPLTDRNGPLFGFTLTIRNFPRQERAARMDEHLTTWEELAANRPELMRRVPGRINSALDAVLPSAVVYLPEADQADARRRIAAMDLQVHGTPSDHAAFSSGSSGPPSPVPSLD